MVITIQKYWQKSAKVIKNAKKFSKNNFFAKFEEKSKQRCQKFLKIVGMIIVQIVKEYGIKHGQIRIEIFHKYPASLSEESVMKSEIKPTAASYL